MTYSVEALVAMASDDITVGTGVVAALSLLVDKLGGNVTLTEEEIQDFFRVRKAGLVIDGDAGKWVMRIVDDAAIKKIHDEETKQVEESVNKLFAAVAMGGEGGVSGNA